MGRLFWKFFLFFFFAQLATALGVGAFVQFNANSEFERGYIDQSPLARSLLEAAESALKLGGTSALKDLLQAWEAESLKHRVYALNENDQDILNRQVKQAWLQEVNKPASNWLVKSATKTVRGPDGNAYTMFTIFTHHKPPRRHIGELRGSLKSGHTLGLDGPPPEFGPPPKLHRNQKIFMRTIKAFPLKALLIAAFASAIFAALLAWYFSKPINALRSAFSQAAKGDLDVRVADKMGKGKDELSDLGQHFDFMASRLSALLLGQKRLLHHVSHELRSPLARMHMALGLAKQDKTKTVSSLDRIELEATRMDKLIGELLELSRFESGMVALEKEPFSIKAMLNSIIDDANFEAMSKGVEIQQNMTTDIQLTAQPELIHRVIENVVRNAVKYSPESAIVSVKTELVKGQSCVITVSDQGDGVLETELEDIFKPFVRGHSGSQVKGHGMGLAIAKQIVEAHQGMIVAENLSPTGFRITISLPIKVS